MFKLNKIPLVLFIVGLVAVGFYGLLLSVIAVILQIFIILSFWKSNPALKQTKKFIVGVLLFVLALILFGIGLYQFKSYFGGIGLITWLVMGAVPFVTSSFILLTIPTASKLRR